MYTYVHVFKQIIFRWSLKTSNRPVTIYMGHGPNRTPGLLLQSCAYADIGPTFISAHASKADERTCCGMARWPTNLALRLSVAHQTPEFVQDSFRCRIRSSLVFRWTADDMHDHLSWIPSDRSEYKQASTCVHRETDQPTYVWLYRRVFVSIYFIVFGWILIQVGHNDERYDDRVRVCGAIEVLWVCST